MSAVLIPFRTKMGMWGYCDRDRTLVLEAVWEQAYPFRQRALAHVRKDQKSGLVDKEGNLVVAPEYDWIGNQDEGWLVEPEGVMLVQNGWTFGVLSMEGELLTPVEHDHGGDALAAAGIPRKPPSPRPAREPDLPSAEILERYEVVHPYREDRAIVYHQGGVTWIDRDGREIVPLGTLASAHPFEDGIALASIPDPDPPTYASPMMQEMAANRVFFGFMDRDGHTVVEFKYANGRRFDHGLAFVCSATSTQWGYIGRDGTEYFED